MHIFWWQLKNTLIREAFWARLFSPIGFAWLVFQIAEKLDYSWLANILLTYGWLIALTCPFYAFCFAWQKKSFSVKLPKYDTEICVKVGNIMRSKSSILFGIPTTLDHTFDGDLISIKSIQGQFSKKYATSTDNMQNAIISASKYLGDYEKLPKNLKPYGPRKKYQEGEVIVLRCYSRLAYLVAFATFNEHKTAQLEVNDFYNLLPRMWEGIRERGNVGDVDMPLLGTVHGRTGLNQKGTFYEIISSFNAACREKRLVDKLTIYIRPQDFTKGDFSFEYLERTVGQVFIDHPEVMNGNNESLGTAVGK